MLLFLLFFFLVKSFPLSQATGYAIDEVDLIIGKLVCEYDVCKQDDTRSQSNSDEHLCVGCLWSRDPLIRFWR